MTWREILGNGLVLAGLVVGVVNLVCMALFGWWRKTKMAALDDLTTEVNSTVTTMNGAAETLGQLVSALKTAQTPPDTSQLEALATSLQTASASLASAVSAAVTAMTPPAPEPVPTPPAT